MIIPLTVVAVLWVFSGVLAMAETSFVRVSRIRMLALEEEGNKRARRVVRQNVYFSIGWMAMLVVVALTVGIPLPLAVVGHEGSTLLVAANGLRLLGGKPHPPIVPPGPRVPRAGQRRAPVSSGRG